MIKEIDGDLISLALAGKFNVIVHGCNCYCIQGKGIALQMSKMFSSHMYPLEKNKYKGDVNKLGQIEYESYNINDNYAYYSSLKPENTPDLFVINAYTQYKPGKNLDYEALRLCLRKINHMFPNQHIGLPRIGCGIAGGDWETVKKIIKRELVDCEVTVINYVK